MGSGFRATDSSHPPSAVGACGQELGSTIWSLNSTSVSRHLPKIFRSILPSVLIGCGAADGTRVLDVLHVGRAHHAGLLHSAAEFFGGDEPAGVFETVPIQQQGHVTGVIHTLKQTE